MALMDIADRTIILTDHTKWSCTSLSLFARFDQVDTVITDDGLDADSQLRTRELVKDLVLAPVIDERDVLDASNGDDLANSEDSDDLLD